MNLLLLEIPIKKVIFAEYGSSIRDRRSQITAGHRVQSKLFFCEWQFWNSFHLCCFYCSCSFWCFALSSASSCYHSLLLLITFLLLSCFHSFLFPVSNTKNFYPYLLKLLLISNYSHSLTHQAYIIQFSIPPF